MVVGRKWTLAAARISAASARVIQSVGAAIGQSEVFDAPDVVGFSVFFDVPVRDEPAESDDPETARRLLEKAQDDVHERWRLYEQWATLFPARDTGGAG